MILIIVLALIIIAQALTIACLMGTARQLRYCRNRINTIQNNMNYRVGHVEDRLAKVRKLL